MLSRAFGDVDDVTIIRAPSIPRPDTSIKRGARFAFAQPYTADAVLGLQRTESSLNDRRVAVDTVFSACIPLPDATRSLS